MVSAGLLPRSHSRGGRFAGSRFALGQPFLLAALVIEPFLYTIKKLWLYFGMIERVTGVLLVAKRVAFLIRSVQDLSAWLLQNFPGLTSLG
ncbi:MAG TPA: hypothetical protein VME69_06300 [Methylocella sp.]|nr:hypothetical protein [Methylocella sp.]